MSGKIVLKKFPVAARVAKQGAQQILAADRARIAKFRAKQNPHGPKRDPQTVKAFVNDAKPFAAAADASSTVDVTDAAVTYTMQVGVGSPAVDYTLLIDTGSSNTWIGADKQYDASASSTSKDQNTTFSVSYGSGSVTGKYYLEQVALGQDLVIKDQGIGVATQSSAQGFSGVDGILGIGPVDLTQGTVKGVNEVPTVTDNLVQSNKTDDPIPTELIGIYYVPTTTANANSENGELTFGDVDKSKILGGADPKYVSITSTSPASAYWGIDQTITYGDSSTTILSQNAGIVDTGTTLLYLASDAFKKYQTATGAGDVDQTTGLLKITEAQFKNLKNLIFNIDGVEFELTPDAQIWPRALNSTLGGDADAYYLIAADAGSNSGSGLDFINGFTWLQRFYTVYDTTNKQVGVAKNDQWAAETNQTA